MSRQGNKGSKRGSMHPYLRLELWANGHLSFWRNSPIHAQDLYENQLQAEISQEKNHHIFKPN